jgi:hypothetical protein
MRRLRKRKVKKPSPSDLIKIAGIISVVSVCGSALASHIASDLTATARPTISHHAVAVGLQSPPATPFVSPAPQPKTITATIKPKKVVRLAVVPRTLPAVVAVPDSAVSHLVPVTTTVPPTQAPTPAPGLGSGGQTSTPSPTATPAPSPPSTHYTSTNWSGYLSPAGNFSDVSGTWTVPHTTGTSSTSTGDAAWIGIGGVTSDDLIQVGTDDTVDRNGQSTTTAFYEMLPASETPIPSMVVTAGDTMSADIHQIAGDTWSITMSDVTRSETFSINVHYASSLSSAEWIEEDPSFSSGGLVPFDTFTPVAFSSSQATAAGVTQTAAAAGAQAIVLVDSAGNPLAVPTQIGPDGQSFSVSRY